MTAYFWVGGTGTWDAVTVTNWALSSGGTGGVAVPTITDTVTFDGNSGGGTVTINTNFSVISVTCGAFTGTIDFSANNNSPTMQTFNSSGSGTRTLSMGTGTFTLTGNNGTILTLATVTGLTYSTTTETWNFTYSGGTGTRSIASSVRIGAIQVSAGSDVFKFNTTSCTSLNMTGFTGAGDTGGVINFTGNMTLAGQAWNATTSDAFTYTGSGTSTLTSNGVVTNHPLTINGTGTLILGDALVLNLAAGTQRTLQLTAGTFNDNGKNVTAAVLGSSGSGVRTLTMRGTWSLNGNAATIWNTGVNTNLVSDYTGSTVLCTYSGSTGTRTINQSAASAARMPTTKITAGTDTFAISNGSTFGFNGDLDFTGFEGTLSGTATAIVVGGSLTLSPTMTNSYTGSLNFDAFSAGTFTITTNGIALASAMDFRGEGLAANYLLGGSLVTTGAITMFNSTTSVASSFSMNGYNLTCASFSSTNTNPRTISMVSGTLFLTGTGTVLNLATTTNLTFTPGTSTIVVNDSSASSKTLSTGGLTFNNLYLTGGGSGTFIIGTTTDTRTFNNIRIDPALSVQFFAASTTKFETLQWVGTSGAGVITLASTTGSTAWNLVSLNGNDVAANFISLQDSAASGAGFFAGAGSTNVSGNSGWTFATSPQEAGGAFLLKMIDTSI